MRAPRVHQAARRRGGAWPLAARAQQPAKAADYRIPGCGDSLSLAPMDRCFCAAAGRSRLDRGPHRRDRISLGGGTPGALRRDRSRVRPAQGRRHRHGGNRSASQLRQATSVIPIVFALANDPVGGGLVASLARPGGNVTGLSNQGVDLAGKRLELLREVRPDLRRLAILTNVGFSESVLEMREAEAGAYTLGIEVSKLEIRRAADIAPAFEALKRRADALYVVVDALVAANRTRIITFALAAHLPTIFNTGDLRRSRGSDVLWTELPGPLPAHGRLCRQDSARSKTRRPTGRAADQVRSRRQLDHREGPRPLNSALVARPRRRGDRMISAASSSRCSAARRRRGRWWRVRSRSGNGCGASAYWGALPRTIQK